ncbi:MAG: oxidoreductase [Alphaproteobacteria bacterium]|nr:oxidoreductase [Alphaproteobacteria bacterium]
MTEQTSECEPPIPHNVLGRSLELPCGAVLRNRIIKTAMSDSLGNGEGDATEAQARLYERWAQGGTAVSIIGEVQVVPYFPEKPGNLVLSAQTNRKAMQTLVSRAVIDGAHLWPQLGHAGALAHAPISTPAGPSALDVPGLKVRGLTQEEVDGLPGLYARGASLAKDLGFTGVQIHAGHGFLLSQFLSPLFNRRDDRHGGSVEARSQIVLQIINEVRRAVGPSFPIGIKINSTDKLEGGLTPADALEVIRLLSQTSVDLIEISGGTYFPGAKASSDTPSDGSPYFLDFARRARSATEVPLMLTGGFERREQAADVIADGAVDVVGLARAMALNPDLANVWLTEDGGDPKFPVFEAPPRGGVTAWYSMQLTALAEDAEDDFTSDPQAAMDTYEERDAERCARWLEKFPLRPIAK